MIRLLALILVLLFTGCVATDTATVESQHWTIGHASAIEYAVEYYPYGPALDRTFTAPRPDFDAWTRRRMQLDLRAIDGGGIDQVQLIVDALEVALDRSVLERVPLFLAEAADRAPDLSIVLLADLRRLPEDRLQSFLDACFALNLYLYENYLQVDNTPLLLFRPAAEYSGVAHIGLRTEIAEWYQPDGFNSTAALEHAWMSTNSKDILLPACPPAEPEEWAKERQRGKPIAKAIAAARALQPRRIVLRSWNDFSDGSFIQKNETDGDEVYHSIRKMLNTGELESE